MKRQTLVVLVKLVLDTSLQAKAETALEVRDKLKMKMIESENVKLLEAQMLGCIVSEDAADPASNCDLVN